MSQRLKPKRSNVVGKIPTTTDLEIGEIAVNMADKKIFVHEPGGTVVDLTEKADLTGYATETYVDTAEADANTYTDNAIAAIPAVDFTGYATETYVTSQGYLTAHQSLAGYALESWTNTRIANELTAGDFATNTALGTVTSNLGTMSSEDAADYSTTAEMNTAINTATTDMATEAYADQAEADALAAANAYTTTQIGNLSIPAAYANSDVDNHLNSTVLDSGDLLGWNGTDYEWAGVGDYIAAAGLAQNYNGGGSATQYSSFVLDGGASTEPSEANGLDGGESGSNNSNWDTAFNWGNHATAGYLTAHQDITGKADVATTLAGYGITDAYTKAEVDGAITAAGGYSDGAVDLHINQSTATGNQVLSWDGADYAWVDQGTTDLTGYATEAFVTSQGYLTAHQDITGKADITYVDSEIASLVASAPGTLDTLNELATALGDDPNFATTVTNSIATKADQSTTYTKTEVDTAVATKLSLSGGTLTGGLTVAGVTETITDRGNISGVYTIDAEAASTHKLTLNGAATFEGFANPAAGQGVTLIVNQDGAGSRLWNTANITIKYADGASTLTTNANATDFVTLFYDGTTYYASFAVGYV